jgi:hypothetical protein
MTVEARTEIVGLLHRRNEIRRPGCHFLLLSRLLIFSDPASSSPSESVDFIRRSDFLSFEERIEVR